MATFRMSDVAQPAMTGVLAAAVGYASTFTLVLAGLAQAGATNSQQASGLFALCLTMGVLNTISAWRTRMPLTFAWSTPGAAFLLGLEPVQGGFPAVVGAFVIVGGLVLLTGLFKPLTRAIAAIPQAIASAMLAGVLLELCLAPVRAVAQVPALALPVLLAWVIGLRFARRFAVPIAVAVAAVAIGVSANVPPGAVTMALPSLVPVMPAFTLDALVQIALPLYVITMASQNLTGIAVMRANGYEVDPRVPFISTGFASALIGIFGAVTVNLAAVSAAIAAGPEAHPDTARRWIAGLFVGIAYFVLAPLSLIVAAFIAATPAILIQAVAGLALLPSLAASLASSLGAEDTRLPAIVTFITTASGITLLGIGGAFWGLLAGIALMLVLRPWGRA
jgi:benzoate membrane transport protein